MSSSIETKAPPDTVSEDWSRLPWRKLEQHVFRLQKRIYRAAQRGNVVAVHRLQQLFLRSRSARLVAVRRVTQENQGKKTAGIDGVKSLTPPERLVLTEAIHPGCMKQQKPRPVRRVWIPKPGKPEKRPLGMPVMRDRAYQALVKQALEPEWEARFEPNSYGFRPGRSQHDAIEAIFEEIKQKSKYVLDADISGCFDHIAHDALLSKLGTYPALRRTIKGWLKAGVMEAEAFTPSEEGTPQGGVISPLLANIALHGREAAIQAAFKSRKDQPALIRYADDFVILHPTLAGVEKARVVMEVWLKDIGLELKPSKTRITHTLEGKTGFDFLGCQVRQYPVGQTHSARSTHGKPLGFKTLIKPSNEAVKEHLRDLSRIVRKHQGAPQIALIEALNPVIQGWANYQQTQVAKRTFSLCDCRLYSMLRRWAQFRHPRKGRHWTAGKYWGVDRGKGGTFMTQDGGVLKKHEATPIKRHTKVKGAASPYDGNLIYWAKRLHRHPLTTTKIGTLLRLQSGKCAYCGLTFPEEDLLEIDHIIPRHLGGDDRLMNLQLLHRHCHDQKTAQLDAALAQAKAKGIYDQDSLTEEPCASKDASTVLERQRGK